MLAGFLELQQFRSACATAGHSVQQQSIAATELCSGFAYQLGLFQEHQVSIDITDHQDVPQASVQSHLAAYASMLVAALGSIRQMIALRSLPAGTKHCWSVNAFHER